MAEEKIHRLWKPIEFTENWAKADTSVLDDLSSSWFARRERLKLDSKQFQEFIGRLKREHAIETGVIERLYDIDRGVTQTLIEKGFIEGLLSHGDANIPTDQLWNHLRDHLEAMDMVFDMIKENRPLSTSTIKELHQLVTRSQGSAEGRDQFGNRTQIPLLKGQWKERENNPTRSDGTVIMYCPPIQVAAEMDRLVEIYHGLEDAGLHPVIIASWVHHALTTIHPFQDGNGRVVRLIASMVLIKHKLFPLTVLRQEAKLRYITALEKADGGEPDDFVRYLCEMQKRQVEMALSVGEVVSESLEVAKDILFARIEELRSVSDEQKRKRLEEQQFLESQRDQVFSIVKDVVKDHLETFRSRFPQSAKIESFDIDFRHSYDAAVEQMERYSEKHSFSTNPDMPAALVRFRLHVDEINSELDVAFRMVHYSNDVNTVAICFQFTIHALPYIPGKSIWNTEIPPHLISILDQDLTPKTKGIKGYIEQGLTLAFGSFANSI